MTTLNISIPESIQNFVNQQITSGNYNNASEYILHLIDLHQQQEKQALAEACKLVDELNLGWDEQWQTQAITDS